jgi:hypothetical protein
VVLRGGGFPRDWIDAVREKAQVFVEQSYAAALASGARLGAEDPGALIIGPSGTGLDADPDAVAFASRAAEANWQAENL